jgi:hypothetical protein
VARFFDPVGIRFRLTGKEVKVETYILPLVDDRRYNFLRGVAAGLARNDPGQLPAGMLCGLLIGLGEGRYTSLFLAGDDPVYQAFIRWQVRRDLEPSRDRSEEYGKLFWRVPFALVVHASKADLEKGQQFLQEMWRQRLRGKADLTEHKYRGTTIRKAPIHPYRYRIMANIAAIMANGRDDDPLGQLLLALPEKEAPAAIYAASVAGHTILSFSEAVMRRQIDTLLAWEKGKKTGEEVNTVLDLGPDTQAGRALRGYLEWQVHRKAQGSAAVWEVLRRAGLDPVKGRDEVRRLLGYVPASPDATPYEVDTRHLEVRNQRHGSLSAPVLHDDLADGSPLAALLQPLKSARVQLRFREDGLHTVLTLQRTVR